jgi:mercuric ion transport protein
MTRTLKQNLLTLPGIGAALLPKLACPLCWPVYASFVSSIGLGFLVSTTYLLPITLGMLLAAIGALAFGSKTRRGYGPSVVGLLGSVAVVVGKFSLESNATMYGGVGLLLAASIWNAWPRQVNRISCPNCAANEGKTSS